MGLIQEIRKLPFGKRTVEAVYVHISGLTQLPEKLMQAVFAADQFIGSREQFPDILKFAKDGSKISFLYYPEFDEDPHPRLEKAITVALVNELPVLCSTRRYDWRKNPPILHRKELFVSAGYPLREEFAALTRAEEEAGLLSSNEIGTIRQWRKLLLEKGYRIDDHTLVQNETGTLKTCT